MTSSTNESTDTNAKPRKKWRILRVISGYSTFESVGRTASKVLDIHDIKDTAKLAASQIKRPEREWRKETMTEAFERMGIYGEEREQTIADLTVKWGFRALIWRTALWASLACMIIFTALSGGLLVIISCIIYSALCVVMTFVASWRLWQLRQRKLDGPGKFIASGGIRMTIFGGQASHSQNDLRQTNQT